MIKSAQDQINQVVEQTEAVQELSRAVGNNKHDIESVNEYLRNLENNLQNTLQTLALNTQAELNIAAITNAKTARTKGMQILVAGFFGAFNLGDELMLETLLYGLADTHAKAEITIMLADNYSCDITRYGNFRFVHYPSTPQELNIMADSYDALIFPGGAIIDDSDYGLTKRPFTLGTILINLSLRFLDMNKVCVLYGLSSNREITNKEFIKKFSSIASRATHFSLRDSDSLDTLSKAGVDVSRAELVDDIVIANRRILSRPKKELHQTGLIYIYTPETLPKLARFTKLLLANTTPQEALKLILFYDYRDNDLNFARQLISKIKDPRLTISSVELGNFSKTVKEIGTCSTIFSMRYHGTLLANFLGRKVICIDYDRHSHYYNKNKYLYDRYGFERNIVEFSSINKVTADQITRYFKLRSNRVDIESFHTEAKKKVLNVLKGVK
jgi:polysaccharide pyruvyl transferase WcaK-like protein